MEKIASICRRCGTCCEKGGPALHSADRELVESGRLPLKHLFTIRPGEPVRDNVKGGITRCDSDIIKIKGRPGTWSCHFFDSKGKACACYEDRPLECRILDCRSPELLESLYNRDRLPRRALLSSMSGIWDLVEDHEHRCSLDVVFRLLETSKTPQDPESQKALTFILHYDTHIRRLVVEKGKMDPEILDFLFGRPLTALLPLFRRQAFP